MTSRFSLRSPPGELIVFISLIAVLVVPLLWFDFVPTEDGPSHVALGTVVWSLLTSSNPTVDSFYVLNGFPVPNLLATVTLGMLQVVFAPTVAERILVGAFVIGLAFAIRYAIGGISADSRILSLLAAPLGLGLVVHLGFYNFIAGVVLAVVAVGYWQRHLGPGTASVQPWRVVALGALLLLTYFGHLLALVAALFFMGVVPLVMSFGTRKSESQNRLGAISGEFWRDTRWTLAAAAPSLVLAAMYVLQSSDAVGGSGRGLAGRVVWFASLSELFVAFSPNEGVFAALIAVAVLVLVVVAIRQRWRMGRSLGAGDGYLVAFVLLGLVYLLIPSRIGGGSAVPERIAMFAFIAVLLWLSHFSYKAWIRSGIVAVAIVAVVGLVGMRWSAYDGFNRDLAEYTSAAETVRDESTVLPLSLIEADSAIDETVAAFRVHPLIEAGGYFTSERGAVNLNHLHAEYDYSPAYFADDKNARLLLGVPPGSPDPIYAVPPNVDVPSFERVSGTTVDYILLWGRRFAAAETLADEGAMNLLALLEDQYEIVFVSPDRGLTEVYGRISSG